MKNTERGFATLIVLVTVMMASVVIAATYTWTRYETWHTQRFLDKEKSLAIARSAIGWGLNQLSLDTTPEYDWLGEDWAINQYIIVREDEHIQVYIYDEGSKININADWQQLAASADITGTLITSLENHLATDVYINNLLELSATNLSTASLSKWFTTYSTFDINLLSLQTWHRLLQALGFSGDQAEIIAEKIQDIRQQDQVNETDGLIMRISELKPLSDNLIPWLVTDGTININTADIDLLTPMLRDAGIDAHNLLAQRDKSPFRSHAELARTIGTEGLMPYLTVRSHFFGINSKVRLLNTTQEAFVNVVVKRSWDEKINTWILQIVSWQEVVKNV